MLCVAINKLSSSAFSSSSSSRRVSYTKIVDFYLKDFSSWMFHQKTWVSPTLKTSGSVLVQPVVFPFSSKQSYRRSLYLRQMSCEFYRSEPLSQPSVDLPGDVLIEFESIWLLFRWDDQGCHIDNESYQWEYFQWVRHTLLVSRRSNRDESRSSAWQCRWLARRHSSSFTR